MTDLEFLTPADLAADTPNPGLAAELALSADALDDDYRTRLVDFIQLLVEQRGFPQHLACVFNALRYGWDPDAGGYHLPLLSDAMFEDIWADETSDAVPVGAFVNVLTVRDIERIPAEIVYKEGRHPDVTPGHVPDDLPGKTAQGTGGNVIVHEALVVDHAAFVDEAASATLDRAMGRIRDTGRELNARGHYVGDMVYRNIDDAELSDLDYFARWLARREETQLLAELLDTDDVGTARTALQQILRSLRVVVDEAAEVELWRGYVYSKRHYDARTDDDTADGVYGADALRRLWRSVAAPPVNPSGLGAPDRVALHPLTLRLHELYSCGPDTPRAELDPSVAAHLDETGWVSTVVHAQVFLSREADVDSTDGGLVASTLARDGVAVHARVDDPWQHGALWRTERLPWPLPDPPPTLLTQPADRPLALGAAPWVDDEPVADQTADTPAADDADEKPSGDEDFLSATFHTWVVRLAPTRLGAGVLPVPAAECASWRPGQPMTVRLRHDGKQTVHSVTFDARRRLLLGMDWPFSVPVAAKVRCQIATGGTLITAYTFALDEVRVITVGGVTLHIGVQVDEAMLRRWLAGTPSRPGAAGHATRTMRPGIADALVGLLAVRGEQTVDGSLRLDLDTLTRLVFPSVEPTARLLSLVLRAAHQAGFRVIGDDVEWAPSAGAGAGVDIDLATLATAGDVRAAQARAAMRPHRVRMHLRRLSVSQIASFDRRRAYPAARVEAGRYDLPERLPEGYTFVVEYLTGD